jgi:microcystin degradation protein MlrC
MRKIFLAMLATETNTFSPLPTGWNVWRDTVLRHRKEHDPTISRRQTVYAPLFARLDARGWTMASGLQAFAVPAGTTPRAVYEALRDELLDGLCQSDVQTRVQPRQSNDSGLAPACA